MRHTAHPALAALLLCSGALAAQGKPSAAIPATAPTQSVSDLPSAHPPVVQASQGQTSVTWTGTQLTIEANGEALPDLLGRVANETGMKIHGGVPDEQVYGKYGPGPVQVVLGELFDGLAINMMLLNDSPTKPRELILTTRTGVPTPPSTRQVTANYNPPPNPPQNQSLGTPTAQAGSYPQSTPQRPPAAPTGTQSAFPPLSAPPAENTAFTNHSNADTSTSSGNTTDTSTTPTTSNDSGTQPDSPSGVRTPEQIFQELQRRQQQSNSQ